MTPQEHLLKIANTAMPFGKYQGKMLVDLPEEYLLWFDKKGFPQGQLGMLMRSCLELKVEGLDELIKPLKK
ncbi:DUF3820 family protein [Pelagibaculum spongiae]|uniref:Cytoplasmic protein n=1 Tax=Pelagibaculum spongiae TaxID=2080658 RepID=A0A2V1GTB7_9GAMM|nr:DUF3820 family protein [Pelagibaculum spongiae]PVZ67626.1 hypothetical protein DC094_14400 [Pelagibaculum spongiae]